MDLKRIRLLKRGLTALLALSLGCSSKKVEEQSALSPDQLMDPAQCQTCHQKHFAEWSGSMHAYASDDPVFAAMNRRGQRETGGALGPFCVNCHAPVAVKTGATTDGLNLDTLPAKLKGVTCYFCHSVDEIEAGHDFNNPLHLAGDGVMRAEIADPVSNTAHHAGYSALHDRDQIDSSRLCGSCHDIVTDHGAHIERTLEEWQASVFSQPVVGTTCSQCHMNQSTTLEPAAQAPNVFSRRTHAHDFPAVDVALTPFPQADEQKAAVQAFLDSTLQSSLCVSQLGQAATIQVILDNVAGGHSFPSGASQDRRLWVEVIAYSGTDVIYQSGAAADGADVTALADKDLWLIRDCMLDSAGSTVHMFWEAYGYESNLLPAQVTFDMTSANFYNNHIYQTYPPRGSNTFLSKPPDRVTMRVRLSPIGRDVIDNLVTSGDLDATVGANLPTFTLGREPLLEWTAATVTEPSFRDPNTQFPTTCVSKTKLVGAATKVPAVQACSPSTSSLGTDGGMPDDAGSDGGAADAGGDGAAVVSCTNDPRVDTYVAALEKQSLTGAFKVQISQADPAPPAKGNNSWIVRLLDATGAGVDGATITADTYMPDHGHGSAVIPAVTPAGTGGSYTVAPLNLFMPGVWHVTLTIDAGGVKDTVGFYFCIQG